MKEKRDETIILRLTRTEKNRIYEKMFSMGIRSLSAYIRKMALDGYCLNLDLPQLRRMAYLLQNCSNNLNQVAKRANESGKIYSADLADLRTRLDELIDIGKQILSKLAELQKFPQLEDCGCIVLVPKYRRKTIYGKLRKDIGKILRMLCDYKHVEIIEAHAMPDHIHMLLSI